MSNVKAKEALAARFHSVTVEEVQSGLVLRISKEELGQVAPFLRDELGLNYLSCLTAVDFKDRLELVIHLFHLERNGLAVTVKVDLPRENPIVASVTPTWPGANWHEREAFDMFGIRFEGHPDLRRILLPENWQGGHPLLKDFEDKRPARERVYQ